MRRIFVNATALAATLLLPAASANAHPHVWITMRSDVVFNDKGEVAGIAVEWTFDDGYTQMALDGLVHEPLDPQPGVGGGHRPVVAHVVQRRRRQPPALHERVRRRLAVERVPAAARLEVALATG